MTNIALVCIHGHLSIFVQYAGGAQTQADTTTLLLTGRWEVSGETSRPGLGAQNHYLILSFLNFGFPLGGHQPFWLLMLIIHNFDF